MSVRPNTPKSLDAVICVPKTASEIYDAIEQGLIFIALAPSDYENNPFHLQPIIVFKAESRIYREWFNCGEYEHHREWNTVQGLTISDYTANHYFLCTSLKYGQEHLSEMFYPIPENMYEQMDGVLSCPLSADELAKMEQSWGKPTDPLVFWAWKAKQLRKNLDWETVGYLKELQDDDGLTDEQEQYLEKLNPQLVL